ncbi:MAG: hypothetical protein KKB79_01220 [Nanoarchaeota archaeon]|nr:hypothetical protein [Nanoarchaeota archaeon]
MVKPNISMTSKNKKTKARRDPAVIVSSLIAFFFIYLTFAKNWLYIIPAVILMMFNQFRLTRKN